MMGKKAPLLILFPPLLLSLGCLIVGPTLPARSAPSPVKIMPLGDSITGSPGCWRALLWNQLQQAGHTTIDFVGTLPPQGCAVAHDGDNEGHGGILATNMADQNQLPPWLKATRPDIVIMHLGTNDVWSNRTPTQILSAFSTLVDQMRSSNPQMKIFVAKIIPVEPSSCPECAARTIKFDDAVPGWARSKTTSASPIEVVDQWTGWKAATDTSDGVHPNDSGIRKMADHWFSALDPELSGTAPTGEPTQEPTEEPIPTPSEPERDCAADYSLDNQWPSGFQTSTKMKNTGNEAISGWRVGFSFQNGQKITRSWNGTVTQSGAKVTVTNAGSNGSLAPSASTELGFLGSWTGTNAAPTDVTCEAL
jgi:lysophospholipase L1-like esterase